MPDQTITGLALNNFQGSLWFWNSNSSTEDGWRVHDRLIAGSEAAYFYTIRVFPNGQIVFWMATADDLTFEGSPDPGPSFTNAFESVGEISLVVENDGNTYRLDLKGTGSDGEEPYEWTPTDAGATYNSLTGAAAVTAFHTAIDGLSGGRTIRLELTLPSLVGTASAADPKVSGQLTRQFRLRGLVSVGAPASTGGISVTQPDPVPLSGRVMSGTFVMSGLMRHIVTMGGLLSVGSVGLVGGLGVEQPDPVRLSGRVSTAETVDNISGTATVTQPDPVRLSGQTVSAAVALSGELHTRDAVLLNPEGMGSDGTNLLAVDRSPPALWNINRTDPSSSSFINLLPTDITDPRGITYHSPTSQWLVADQGSMAIWEVHPENPHLSGTVKVGDVPASMSTPFHSIASDGTDVWLIASASGVVNVKILWRLDLDDLSNSTQVGALPSGLLFPASSGFFNSGFYTIDVDGQNSLWSIDTSDTSLTAEVGDLPLALRRASGLTAHGSDFLCIDERGRTIWAIDVDTPGDSVSVGTFSSRVPITGSIELLEDTDPPDLYGLLRVTQPDPVYLIGKIDSLFIGLTGTTNIDQPDPVYLTGLFQTGDPAFPDPDLTVTQPDPVPLTGDTLTVGQPDLSVPTLTVTQPDPVPLIGDTLLVIAVALRGAIGVTQPSPVPLEGTVAFGTPVIFDPFLHTAANHDLTLFDFVVAPTSVTFTWSEII